MIHIETDGPIGREYDEWREQARAARDEVIEEWRHTGVVPKLDKKIWKELKEIFLNKIFNEKCAYCESRPTASSPLDVEHYRPKEAVTEGRVNVDRHDGYFWLAYEWSNLILACRNCNSWHPVYEDGVKISTHPGKSNEFRIRGERVCEPADDPEQWYAELEGEEPLLLNPHDSSVDPEEHIDFDDNGFCYPRGKSERGRETIDVCDLNRYELVRDRNDAKERLYKKFYDVLSQENCNPNQSSGRFFGPSQPFSAWLNHCVVVKLMDMARRQGYQLSRK